MAHLLCKMQEFESRNKSATKSDNLMVVAFCVEKPNVGDSNESIVTIVRELS